MKTFAAALAALALAACSAIEDDSTNARTAAAGEPDVSSAESARIHPQSGLELIDVSVTTDDETYTFLTEVAASAEEQSRGLMFRTELGDFEGMIFPSDPPRARSFWMRNTPLSLDIIFIGTDGRITNIAANAVPYSTDSVASDGLTSAVFEIRGGRAAALGIEPGNRVEWELPK